MPTSAVTYGYKNRSLVEYGIQLDFIYTVEAMGSDSITISVQDDSIYDEANAPTSYSWKLTNGDTVFYTGTEESFVLTFPMLAELTVEYTVVNASGTSSLVRILYFNTFPTIKALLSRTSTAISKDTGGNNYKLFSLDGDEYDMIYSTIPDLMKSGYIKYATGIALDYLAAMWKIYRDENESDDALRTRLLQAIVLTDSYLTKQSIHKIITTAFGVADDEIIMVERTDLPDYTWANQISSDMNPYDPVGRPAEFTFYVTNGPINPVLMSSVYKAIHAARAAGVYFNEVKITFIVDYEISVELTEFEVYEDIWLETIFGWSWMMWGSPEEVLIENSVIATHTFDESGTYRVTALCYGSNFDAETVEIQVS